MSLPLRIGACLALVLSLPLSAAENTPMHAQFLPPDDLSLRQEQPDQQQLIQITEYSVVLGSQRQSNQQPIPITSPAVLRLKGKPLSKGADVRQVVIQFDVEGKSLKKPGYDPQTRILSLNYPMAQYAAVLDLLRNGPVYCQFLSYPNGHVWADLHSGAVRLR
ncbi:hypothetical protein SA496_21430 [Pseudomonas sp. JS3066]|jgi:hypothetical protein|uniref:hypothetical protein n=1 Tax=unclassified Pseudomonas TaxID=196821 RepID=UPI000EA9B3BC|nr:MULTISPECIES: hypothetical protein [unclassified Pseudomonas]AYF90178.1 hypothetical protein D6Z43_24715 [Pseudomonas sp. DY-1]MDH4652416.1 hypothetical protein [Pseudomonas sp. BN606]MRK20748.1 hypothetical protein [Pseudomonas sp. JG-B]WVK92264.1 hypothetical protein SA496_21430 [Pseudomonas sp. JS3066]